MSKTFTIHVNHLGELGAGIMPYSDEVYVEVASGDLGGPNEEIEFTKALLQFFQGWYEGAKVTIR